MAKRGRTKNHSERTSVTAQDDDRRLDAYLNMGSRTMEEIKSDWFGYERSSRGLPGDAKCRFRIEDRLTQWHKQLALLERDEHSTGSYFPGLDEMLELVVGWQNDCPLFHAIELDTRPLSTIEIEIFSKSKNEMRAEIREMMLENLGSEDEMSSMKTEGDTKDDDDDENGEDGGRSRKSRINKMTFEFVWQDLTGLNSTRAYYEFLKDNRLVLGTPSYLVKQAHRLGPQASTPIHQKTVEAKKLAANREYLFRIDIN